VNLIESIVLGIAIGFVAGRMYSEWLYLHRMR
jgi:hypothetical protein